MNTNFDFSNLFVLDLANNHAGKVQHGLRVVQEIGAVVRENNARGALKFQFRQMDTFIHPAHHAASDNKHIPRFLSTRLSKDDYAQLTDAVRENGMMTICTPFDEESVDVIQELDIEVIKIASCSATDWPLLEKVAECGKPVIFSTGGLALREIDDIVSFFEHRRVHFAIMHCISIYPTPDAQLNLNQIDLLKRRYPDKVIGFSTHEDPNDISPAMVSVAKGAQMLERHVGIETDEIKLNAYSSTPFQVDAWIKAAHKARVMCGADERLPSPEVEMESLRSLQRGVYAKRPLKKDAMLERSDVYFAMPIAEGQLASGDWKSGIVLQDSFDKDGALSKAYLEVPHDPDKQILYDSIHAMKAMLNEARIALPTDFETEFSHHYGVDNFAETGIAMVTCVNRTYCKKLILQMPGQKHPSHYHKRKEETFHILHGTLEMEIEGRKRVLYPGDLLLVQQGVWHSFQTETGVIFEEVSTQHFNDDSFYEDKEINRTPREKRKTVVNQWGRYQI